ncbi:hypothetical protein DRN58_03845 [Thermococci archaeon]|nr:MAG: hypothetical protein DRN58_03845 [Thermococci archaeon]
MTSHKSLTALLPYFSTRLFRISLYISPVPLTDFFHFILAGIRLIKNSFIIIEMMILKLKRV